MKTRRLLVFAVAFAMAAVGSAQAAKKSGGAKPAASGPSAMAAADLKWADLDPKGAPGVKVADVWGDHAKGAFGAFIKFPAGFATPLHTHTNAFKIVVISGTFVQTPEGKAELRLGPGSYLMQPGGKYRHTSGCDKASECELFVQSTGKFDLIPAEAAKK